MEEVEILNRSLDWSQKRHQVRDLLARHLSETVEVEGDRILILDRNVALAAVEEAGPGEYLVKVNDNGDARGLVGGGTPVSAGQLISKTRELIDSRKR